jgi:hypothetical protein
VMSLNPPLVSLTSLATGALIQLGKHLDAVLDSILRVLVRRRQSAARVEPLKFVRRGSE